MEDDAEVIGVCLEGRARAYAISALSGDPHCKVVNDVLAGRAVTVAYCDFTRYSRVFSTKTSSAPLELGVGGWDRDKGLLLHLEGINYALEDGMNLTHPQGPPLPFACVERARTTWGQWRLAHPDSDAYVSPPAGQLASDQEIWPGIRQPPTRTAAEVELEEDAEVIGVCVGGQARAYWTGALSGNPEFHVVNDMLAGRPVTVAYCDFTHCARTFTSTTGSAPLEIAVGGWNDDKGMMLYINGVRYALKDGVNLTHREGPPLPYQRMDHERMTWGKWRRAHPATDVYILPPPCP